MERSFPQRKHPRLREYDYASSGAYFVTICTDQKRCLLSHIVGRGLAPAETGCTGIGKIAETQLLALHKRFPTWKVEQYVIMPNHIHMLLWCGNETAGASPRPTLFDVICAYKSLTTRICKKQYPITKLFQTSFYEHVIRMEEDYIQVANYIRFNPSQWKQDRFYAEE